MDNRFVCAIITILLIIKLKLYQAPVEQRSADDISVGGFLYKEVSGEIGSSSFYYKKIEEGKNFYLILESTTGDTDLYVSYKDYPQIQTSNHDYSSYSCGSEQIPLENKRPAFIGVYCYSQYENCTFRLEIYKTNLDLSLHSNHKDRHSVESAKQDPDSEKLINVKVILFSLLQVLWEASMNILF